MNMQEAVSSFQSKYNFPAIWEVSGNEELETIYVYTSDAKVWVDLPSYHEGYEVKMVVGRKSRPVATKSTN
ncbi:MAG: hypothetical protein E6R04_11495 [Spirochaetes bacterium]|nr:MAG: hypothetical protein E6R04_11495 [Spirochaetota bacterium]